MSTSTRAKQSAEGFSTNPLFNNRKLKLGTFSTNLGGGCAISTVEGTLKVSWPNTLELGQMADDMEFEALVPVGRWKGFGGETNFNGPGFECFSWAAGMAGATKYSSVFATSHVPTIHPCLAAKQAGTVDHISNGRFALNIVCGWHKSEIEMFGVPMLDHDVRYDMAEEWLDVVKLMWGAEGEFDYEGKFYKVDKGFMEPKPLQQPFPPIMNAGGSDRGRHFTAKNCDVAFVHFASHELEACRAQVERYHKLAREEYNREIQVWTFAYVVQGDTEKDARDFYKHYVHEKGDWVAATNLCNTMGINSQAVPKEALAMLKEHFIAGWGGYPLIGTADQIVEGLQTLAKTGVNGTLLSWPRYAEGMHRFQTETMPLVIQAGLR
jgi:FMNH2-dependent dimethyl sulfone monooxygenase